MNDTELDRLLNSWEPPAPRRSLWDGLRERFPQRERLGFARPLRWAAAIVLVCAALTVVTMAVGQAAQTSNYQDSPIVRFINHIYENFVQGREARRVEELVVRIKASDPKVYVDKRLIGPPEFGPAKTIILQVPDEGLYSVSLYRFMGTLNAVGRPTGWVEAGRVHDNVVEFEVDGKQIRIECNQPIVGEDRPVFIRRE